VLCWDVRRSWEYLRCIIRPWGEGRGKKKEGRGERGEVRGEEGMEEVWEGREEERVKEREGNTAVYSLVLLLCPKN